MDLFNSVINNIITPVYQLIVGCTLVYFLGAAAFYIWQSDNDEARSNAKQHLLWGGIGLFMMFSVGGILAFIDKLLGGAFGL
jgi:hypothetical protein